MKLVVIMLVVVGGVVIAVSVVGVFLPTFHRAHRMVTYRGSRTDVWEVIAGFERWPEWQPGLLRMERLPDRAGQPVWRQMMRRRGALNMMVVETDLPRRLRTEVVDNRQYGGTWTWDLEPTNEGGCHLTITEDGAIYNVVFRFVARFFMDYQATIDRYHQALTSKFGESTNDKSAFPDSRDTP